MSTDYTAHTKTTDSDNLYTGVRSRGTTSTFFENKGFGWLLEVEDDEEDNQKPLLYDNNQV